MSSFLIKECILLDDSEGFMLQGNLVTQLQQHFVVGTSFEADTIFEVGFSFEVGTSFEISTSSIVGTSF